MNDTAKAMDRQYRFQRFVYDWSRKYYLLGRDRALNEISFNAGDSLLEIGSSTARNLIKLAFLRPDILLCGIDASTKMLETAAAKIQAKGLKNEVLLAHGFAETFAPNEIGHHGGFDHILFSYSLSMIPDWRGALDNAFSMLKPGGSIHIVDFYDLANLPKWAQALLLQWLEWFHVYPQALLPDYLETIASVQAAELTQSHTAGRYALIAHLKKSPQT